MNLYVLIGRHQKKIFPPKARNMLPLRPFLHGVSPAAAKGPRTQCRSEPQTMAQMGGQAARQFPKTFYLKYCAITSVSRYSAISIL